MVHPADLTARFEPCIAFRHADHDPLVCECGWLEDDHSAPAAVVVVLPQARRPRVSTPVRRAS